MVRNAYRGDRLLDLKETWAQKDADSKVWKGDEEEKRRIDLPRGEEGCFQTEVAGRWRGWGFATQRGGHLS